MTQKSGKDALIESCPAHPMDLFQSWYEQAKSCESSHPNAFVLSTLTDDGVDARVVLARSWDEKGFVFYTNQGSAKGQQLTQNPACSAVFYWPCSNRQIRVQGKAHLLEEAKTKAFFATQSRPSQAVAIVSHQSKPISSMDALKSRFDQTLAQEQALACPSYWKGFVFVPVSFEFYEGKDNHLNERLKVTQRENHWIWQRLSP